MPACSVLTTVRVVFTINCDPVTPPEIIAVLPPVLGYIGQTIVILGNGFTDITEVTFNSIEVDFTIVSDEEILAVVPINATLGPITLSTGVVSAVFPYTAIPPADPQITQIN